MKIIVKVNEEKLSSLYLEESKQSKKGRYIARKDSPHVQGDEYHAHCTLPGGKKIAWTITGKRKHPSQFPADDKIPADVKKRIASINKVDTTTLEWFIAFDEIAGPPVLLLEQKMNQFEIIKELLKNR